jgi:hypothetical protein
MRRFGRRLKRYLWIALALIGVAVSLGMAVQLIGWWWASS